MSGYRLWHFLDRHVARKRRISPWLWERRIRAVNRGVPQSETCW